MNTRHRVILSLDPLTIGFRVRVCDESGLDDEGVARCQRPTKHEGQHAHFEGDAVVVWDLRPV